ncbi:hypothetical protein GQX73_g5228 [Xylaria multiplex]|uniref:Uncharacterized protein n=1 Tax=Xylaria multiplex TaxID=323545 RepID=A0A7C8N7A9_9PEZI|nr:hypothetical protein GQX73_g5228 [Xylaria multiplex]
MKISNILYCFMTSREAWESPNALDNETFLHESWKKLNNWFMQEFMSGLFGEALRKAALERLESLAQTEPAESSASARFSASYRVLIEWSPGGSSDLQWHIMRSCFTSKMSPALVTNSRNVRAQRESSRSILTIIATWYSRLGASTYATLL